MLFGFSASPEGESRIVVGCIAVKDGYPPEPKLKQGPGFYFIKSTKKKQTGENLMEMEKALN